MNDNDCLFLDLNIDNDNFTFASSVSSALSDAEAELHSLDNRISETLETIKNTTPECDKADYALSVYISPQ